MPCNYKKIHKDENNLTRQNKSKLHQIKQACSIVFLHTSLQIFVPGLIERNAPSCLF
jgi:hypothetical protein